VNIYYMGESQTDSEFPIVRWNPQVARNVGATQLPTEEYESKLQGWGEPEKMNLGPDVWSAVVNNTDRDRKDTFPKDHNKGAMRDTYYNRNEESEE